MFRRPGRSAGKWRCVRVHDVGVPINAAGYDTALVVEPYAPTTTTDGFRRAWTWIEDHQREVGGQTLVYALWGASVNEHPGLSGYRRWPNRDWDRRVRLASHKGGRGVVGWDGGPVLAIWPSRESLGAIAEDPRTRGLCVLTSQDIAMLKCVDGWRLAARPLPLGPVPPVTAHPDAIDAVAVAGLRALQAVIGADPEGLSRQRAERAMILARLRALGRTPRPNDAYAWALVNGWSVRAAELLRSMAGNVHTTQRPAEPDLPSPVDPSTREQLDRAGSPDH
jgi:hypothetical protein